MMSILASTLLAAPATGQEPIGTANFPFIGLEMTLHSQERDRYMQFRQNNPHNSREAAVAYLSVHPDACTQQQPCSYTPVSAREIRAAFARERFIQPREGITWRVSNPQAVPQELLEPVCEEDFILVSVSYSSQPADVLRREHFPRALRPCFIEQRNQQERTYSPSPARTDAVRAREPLPEGVLLMQRNGRQYTFPGANMICYEGTPRRCVPLPER